MKRLLSVLLLFMFSFHVLSPTIVVGAAEEYSSFVPENHYEHTLEVGSTLEFGQYEQDNNEANGPENIEWIVLDVQGDEALVISHYALDSVAFHATNEDGLTWEHSDMRKWLNEEFYYKAFNDTQRSAIQKTVCHNEAEKSHRGCAYAGPDTEDNIFLLSIYQADFFFTNDENRKALATPYSKSQGVLTYEDGTCQWYLRSSGAAAWQIAFVDNDGSLGTYSSARHDSVATRPAMRLRLNALPSSAFPQNNADNTPKLANAAGAELLPMRCNHYALPFEHSFGDKMRSNQIEHSDLTLLGIADSSLYLERNDNSGFLFAAGYYFPDCTSLTQAQKNYKEVQEFLSQECASLKKETKHTDLIYGLIFLAVLSGGREWESDHYYDEDYGVHIEHLLFQWGENGYRHTITYVVEDLDFFQNKLQQTHAETSSLVSSSFTGTSVSGQPAPDVQQPIQISSAQGNYNLTVDNIHVVDWSEATQDMSGVKIVAIQCAAENISFSGIYDDALSNYEIATKDIAFLDDEGFALEFYDGNGNDGVYEVNARIMKGMKKRISLPFFAPEGCNRFTLQIGESKLDLLLSNDNNPSVTTSGSSSFFPTDEATALLEQGQYERAIELFKQSGEEQKVSDAYYAWAVAQEKAGDLRNAVLNYRKSGKPDAIARARTLLPSGKIDGYLDHTVGLKADGTVVATGKNNCGECNVEEWQNIVAVDAGDSYTLGLKADGTLVSTGKYSDGQRDVSKWENIVAISASSLHSIGLKADGTLVATGFNGNGQCEVDDLSDVVAIHADWLTYALKADGTIEIRGDDFDSNQIHGIVDFVVDDNIVVALRSDGTIACIVNKDTKHTFNVYDLSEYNELSHELENWSDIIALSGSDTSIIGLKADGTVVAAGINYYGQCNVQGWTDVVAISAGRSITVALCADGSVLATGDNTYGQCNTESWNLN